MISKNAILRGLCIPVMKLLGYQALCSFKRLLFGNLLLQIKNDWGWPNQRTSNFKQHWEPSVAVFLPPVSITAPSSLVAKAPDAESTLRKNNNCNITYKVNSCLANTLLLWTLAIIEKTQIPIYKGLTENDSPYYGLSLFWTENNIQKVSAIMRVDCRCT